MESQSLFLTWNWTMNEFSTLPLFLKKFKEELEEYLLKQQVEDGATDGVLELL